MGQTVRDVMTPEVIACDASTPLAEAARLMRDRDIGDVLVSHAGQLRGIVTDRDIVVRCVAEGGDISSAILADACSGEIVTVGADTSISDAVQIMRANAIRRLPVTDNGSTIGVVTLGDLAIDQDPQSALADISQAPPDA